MAIAVPQADAAKPAHRLANMAEAVILFALCLWIFSTTAADPDLWGHLRFGHDTLAAGGIVRTDPYSFMTAGTAWINHEWLSEVIFALIYGAFGLSGLVLFKTGISLGIVMFVRQQLVWHGVPAIRRAFPLLLMILLLPSALGTIRPQMFTYLAFAVTVGAICRREGGARRSLWLLPLVFLLWANLHGGFLAGAGILLVWLGGRALEAVWRYRTDVRGIFLHLKDDIAPVAVSLLATLVNPYGIGLWNFLLRTATVPRPEISEWQPLGLTTALGAIYLATLALTGAAILASRRPRRPALMLPYICLALLPLMAIRNLPLFAVGAVLVAAPYFADASERWLGPYVPHAGNVLLGVSVASLAVSIWVSAPKVSTIKIIPSDFPAPVRASALLAATKSTGKIAVDFDWGEYVIWHVGPRIQVSLDGRRETVYSEASYQENLNFLFGRGKWDAVLNKADLALVKQGSPAYNLLRLKPVWSLIYEDSFCGLFAAKGSRVGAELRALTPPDLPPNGAGTSFP